MGLGELSILLSFGPIPSLGAYYVLTRSISPVAFVVPLATGLLTVNILMMHDLIFYEPYKQAGKRSLAVVLGVQRTQAAVTAFAAVAYIIIESSVLVGWLPPTGLLCFAALPLFLLSRRGGAPGQPPPVVFGTRTMRTFLHSVTFTLLLAAGLFLA